MPFQAVHAQRKFERSNDPDFDLAVASPAFTDTHPRVLLDEAHFNYHTSDGLYKPLVDLITNDGCRVTPNKKKFSAKASPKNSSHQFINQRPINSWGLGARSDLDKAMGRQPVARVSGCPPYSADSQRAPGGHTAAVSITEVY
jgi:hypothetical protein